MLLQVRVDPKAFLSSFSYEDGGVRKTVAEWELAPHVNGMLLNKLVHSANDTILNPSDPDKNAPRRSAAKGWNNFSDKTTAVIPFSIIRNDNRALRAEKEGVSSREFSVRETEYAGDVDGAERPAPNNFIPGLSDALFSYTIPDHDASPSWFISCHLTLDTHEETVKTSS